MCHLHPSTGAATFLMNAQTLDALAFRVVSNKATQLSAVALYLNNVVGWKACAQFPWVYAGCDCQKGWPVAGEGLHLRRDPGAA
jgi:hypothetical protein